MVVAVILLSSLVVIGLLVLGILGIASKTKSQLDIETKAVAIPFFKIDVRVKYTPPDRPPIGANQVESPGTALPGKAEPGSGVTDVT
jgi:hypothetical protein